MEVGNSTVKYKEKDAQLWQFTFLPDEVKFIREYKEVNKKLYFALICGQEMLQDSEIALLSLDEVKECLDVDYDRDSYRITVKREKGIHGLKVYGTGRADILDEKDNTIRIPRGILTFFTDK